MTTIQSATGPLDTNDMGFTLTHEHVLVASPPILAQYPDRFDLDADLAIAVDNLKAAYEVGVRTIVDLTPITLGRNAPHIRRASEQSGMQIIVATGLYYYHDVYFSVQPTDAITDLFVQDIEQGIGDTGIHAGVIKAATEPEMTRLNQRFLRATARAHRRTGVPIGTHTFPEARTGLDQIGVFQDEGVDLGRVIIGHSDDSDDIDYLDQIIQAGAYCGMDRIGLPNPRSSEQRADMVAALIERGYASRITLSHDAGRMHGFSEEVKAERIPDWRYTFIPLEFSQLLRDRGVSDDAIKQMTIRNPRAIFEQTQPY
jgi:phosphotriesterase-related protein